MITTKIDNLAWTEEWPTEPGTYLYYGDYGKSNHEDYKPRLQLCTAKLAGPPDKRCLTLVASGCFLYKSEQTGMFARIEVSLPVTP